MSVPDTFTWTVLYDGTGNTVTNRIFDPPAIGSSDNSFYWRRRMGSGPWEVGTFAVAPANFYARIEAVPEPTTAVLLGLGVAGLATMRNRRLE